MIASSERAARLWPSHVSICLLMLGTGALSAGQAWAQSSSLLGSPDVRPPLTMASASWTYQPPSDVKTWKVNDFVTVMLEEKMQMTHESTVDQQRQAQGVLTLKNWVLLHRGLDMKPDPQSAGSPGVAGLIDDYYRAQANLQNTDNFQSSVQCVVVDIRPNGSLVLEGHASVRIDDEQWQLSVSGVVRPEDIMPNNTVKSEKMAEKRIERLSEGHGRDGVRRGWLLKAIDKFKPF